MRDAHDTSKDLAARSAELAQQQGQTYREALRHMIDQSPAGSVQQVRDMVIGFVQTPAEGIYVTNAEGELEWMDPRDANCHLMVAVMDTDDHRFIPYCDVNATIFGENNDTHGPWDIPFTWHPYLYHYGRNIALPGDDTYDVRIQVNPLMFPRHDRENGNRYAHPVEVVFQNAELQTGQH